MEWEKIDTTEKKDGLLDRGVGRKGLPKEHILIVCEGKCTEPNYFKAFHITSAEVSVQGVGHVTKSLVEYAIKLREEAEYPYDQVWCVFDKDDFTDFDDAINFAYKNDIKVAYTNQAFELWYVLHFNLLESALHRKQYQDMLTERLGKTYQKNDPSMYSLLLEKQPFAIKNAERLLERFANSSQSKSNPSTTVHLLVLELNKFIYVFCKQEIQKIAEKNTEPCQSTFLFSFRWYCNF